MLSTEEKLDAIIEQRFKEITLRKFRDLYISHVFDLEKDQETIDEVFADMFPDLKESGAVENLEEALNCVQSFIESTNDFEEVFKARSSANYLQGIIKMHKGK